MSILPEFVFAQISTFLGKGPEGDFLRKFTGTCGVRDDIKDATYRNGVLHSYDDKPARIHYEVEAQWYKNGKLHREGDKPACIKVRDPEIFSAWYKNGELHRDNDLPALIQKDKKTWYKNGTIHRDNDKPAYTDKNTQKWFKNGLLHRENDLPAKTEYFYFNNYTEPEYTLEWYRNGLLHRDGDHPALIRGKEEHVLLFLDKNIPPPKSSEHARNLQDFDLPTFFWGAVRQEWYQDGLLHREGDKPAVRSGSTCAMWYKKGKKHRDVEGKPVAISGNTATWIVDGKEGISSVSGVPPYHQWY